MSVINKEPYITPEMIAAWNSLTGRVYYYPNQVVSISGQWGTSPLYYGDWIVTMPEIVKGKKILVTCVGIESGFFTNPIRLNNYTDYQLDIRFYRPTSMDVTADIIVLVCD